MIRRLALVLASALALAAPAAAEVELSVYTGWQTAPHSDVSGNDPTGVGAFSFGAGWEGRPFDSPPYYGLRAMWWRDGGPWGYGVEFNHAKVYADDDTLASSGFERLEFTDGLNYLTLNVHRRWQSDSRWTPYVGAGIGLSIPYVEVQSSAGAVETREYQVTGPAVQIVAGAAYALNDRWSVFGEYKGAYSSNTADLDGGGKIETDIITNALNFGVSWSF